MAFNQGTLVSTDINSALSFFFDEELARQFNRSAVTAAIVEKRPGSGQGVNWDIVTDRTTHAAAFTEGSDVASTEFNTDPKVKASLGWSMYRSAFALSGLSVAIAQSSPMSPLEMLNQFEENLVDAASDLISQINSDLWVGPGTGNRIAGIVTGGALTATGTYAGVNRSTYANFAGNVNANGGTARALTKSLLDSLEASIYRASGQSPRLIITTPETVTKYEALFDSQARVVLDRGDISAISKTPNVGGPWVPSNTGYTGLSYKGMPIFRDRNCPAGTLAFVNPDHLKIRPLTPSNIQTATMAQTMAANATNGSMFASTGIFCKVESLAKTGDADKFQLVTYLQLQAARPNAHGLLQDISET